MPLCFFGGILVRGWGRAEKQIYEDFFGDRDLVAAFFGRGQK